MIEPYNAVGLIPSFWGIRRREEIKHNIEHLKGLTKAAFWLSNLDIPVRLLAIPEGALMGFNDEVLDVDTPTTLARVASMSLAPRPTRLASSRGSGTSTSWRKPRRVTKTGRIASSTSGSLSIRTATSF